VAMLLPNFKNSFATIKKHIPLEQKRNKKPGLALTLFSI
jgi:hypothetical protein